MSAIDSESAVPVPPTEKEVLTQMGAAASDACKCYFDAELAQTHSAFRMCVDINRAAAERVHEMVEAADVTEKGLQALHAECEGFLPVFERIEELSSRVGEIESYVSKLREYTARLEEKVSQY